MTACDVSVVLCANSSARYPLLVAAVGSVLEQTQPASETIVVIDHNPGLLKKVARTFPDLTVVENVGPPGLSGARNTGVAASSGDVVAFLDDDADADSEWLAEMTAHYERPEVLGVSGYAEPNWQDARPRWWPEEFDWVVGCGYRGLPVSTAPVRNLMGCAMSLRRHVIDAVGGFDTSLGRTASGAAGCEETELCIRAAASFSPGVFLHEPAARVRHYVSSERSTFYYFRSRCFAEGVSKFVVAKRVGAGDGLASETDYVRRTLSSAALQQASGAARGDLGGLLRVGAIAAGLGATTAGLLWAGARRMGTTTPTLLPYVDPVLPLVLDIADPLQPLPEFDGADAYSRASCLLLLAGDQLGVREIALDGTEATTGDLLRALDIPVGGSATTLLATEGHRHTSADMTVAIATRNRPERLAECLASIASGTSLPERIIVVDNARSDDLTELLIADYRAEGWEIQYVREDRPGLAYAHNAAIAQLETGLVAFTDDDVVIHDRWIEQITRAFDDDSETVCVTGLIAPRELETLAQQLVEAHGIFSKGFTPRVFDGADHRSEDPMFPFAAGMFGSGANMSFRVDYLRETGGFDVALGTGTVAMGGDDLAAFYDVIRHGRRLTYVPTAIVMHPHHRDYTALRRQVYGYGAGLGAHLTRVLMHQPGAAVTLLRNRRTAAARLANILHPAAVSGLPAYPRELSRVQRRGLVTGPARYMLSRYRARGDRRLVRA